MIQSPLFYFSYFSLVFTFSIVINNLFLKFSRTLGTHRSTEAIRWSDVHKPAVGGIAFYIIFLLTLTVLSLFFDSHGLFPVHSQIVGLLSACTIAFLIGLADDAYDTEPILKFSAQVLCGIVLIYSGIYIQAFDNIYLNYMFTMFWVIGLMNSINLLDNMDGIASIAVLGALYTMIAIALIENAHNNIFFILMLGASSCILAFLLFNWYPSKMYMGDTGTQFLGLLLAALSILFLWNGTSPSYSVIPQTRLISAILAFSLPIIDTSVVFCNRILRGSSPFKGGKDHTTHHLFYLGLTEVQIAIVYTTFSAICLSFVVMMNRFDTTFTSIYSIAAILYFVLSLIAFFIITRVKKTEMQTTVAQH